MSIPVALCMFVENRKQRTREGRGKGRETRGYRKKGQERKQLSGHANVSKI